MGTNYYFYPSVSPLNASIRILEGYNEENPETGQSYHAKALELLHEAKEAERIHIGKSSGGWCFALHVTETIRSLEDWKSKWVDGVIVDEYGREYTPEEMIKVITRRGRAEPIRVDFFYKSVEEFLQKNHAEHGPKNLLRHKIGLNCVGHGEETYDLIEGDFS